MRYIDKLSDAVGAVVAEGKFRVVKINIHKTIVDAILGELEQMVVENLSYTNKPEFIGYPMEVIYGDDAPDWIFDLEPLQNNWADEFKFIGWRHYYGIDKGSPDGDYTAIATKYYPTA